MAISIRHSKDGGAIVVSQHAVNVTIVHVGKRGYAGKGQKTLDRLTAFEQKMLDGSFVKLNRPMCTPNGRLNFRASIVGLPVVTYLPWTQGDKRGIMFRTPGGSIVRIEPHNVALPEEFLSAAKTNTSVAAYQSATEKRLNELEAELDAEASVKWGAQPLNNDRDHDIDLDDLTGLIRVAMGPMAADVYAVMRADGSVVVRGRKLDAGQQAHVKEIIKKWRTA